MNFLDRIVPKRLSVSVTIFILSSVFVRFIGIGCIGLAFYIKYGDSSNIIDDSALPALNSIEIYGMPFGSYMQSLVFGTAIVFCSELVTGVIGAVAGMGKKNTVFIAYIFLCMLSILVYITLIVLWSILYYFIKHDLESCFTEYNRRYKLGSGTLINGYYEKWQSFYSTVRCCGSSGNDCTGDIRCQHRYEPGMILYCLAYIAVLIFCILCQICSILAADYTIIKKEIKANNNKKVSQEKSYVLCLSGHGIISIFRKHIREAKNHKPACMTSVIIKIVALFAGSGMAITSLRLLASGLLHKSKIITFFENVHAYNYNLHNSLTGFGCSILAIGCFTIGNAIIGIIGSRKKSTTLHSVAFFGSFFLAILKIIAGTVWIIMVEKFNRSISNDLITIAEMTDTVDVTNQVMLFFKCCGIGTKYVQQFCYSNVHESVTQLSHNYYNSDAIHGLIGDQDNHDWCGPKISRTIKTYSAIHFTFLAIGLISDILTPIFISKEFKENQKLQQPESDEQINFHLVSWYLFLYRKNSRRFLVRFFYILMIVFMLMFELSFIVLVAIYGVSYHVNRDYIDDIGDLFKFLAISGLVLVPLFIVNRFIGLAAVFTRRKKILYVSTGLTVQSIILSSTYVIMASILRHLEYPCSYLNYSTGTVIGCSSKLKATSSVAIGMFVFEFVSQILSLVLNDRGYTFANDKSFEDSTTEPSQQPGLFKMLYHLNKEMFKANPRLGKSISGYAIACFIMMLIEITFVVLDCFYGFTWLLDRRWITTGLHNIQRGTINVGVLFNFLRISFLALIPIISINRVLGGVAVIKRHRKVLYLNTIVTIFTTIFTLICLSLSSVVMESLAGCHFETTSYGVIEECPTRKKTILGTAIAILITELLIQTASLIVNDRCYKYFSTPDGEGMEVLISEKDRPIGLFAMVYNKTFRRREQFQGAKKLEVAIGFHVAFTLFLLMIEITFFVLAVLYGLTSVINRDWIEVGLDDLFVTSMDMEVLYKFLAICSVVLIPLMIINRFVGIVAVSKKWKSVLYVNSALLGVSLVIITVCLILGSVLLHQEPNCDYTINSVVNKSCPRMKATVGIGLGVLIVEFLMQVFSVIINDRSHVYISKTDDDKQEEGKGMFALFHGAVFRRRKPFGNKVVEMFIAVYDVTSMIMLMLEISFIVLDAVYGLSYVLSRKWIDFGLGDITIISIDLYTLYKFLSIGMLVLVVILAANRVIGHVAISTNRIALLYVNTVISIITIMITIVFAVLTIMLLSAKDECSYDNGVSCIYMPGIVGSGLAMLLVELVVQIYSLVINDRNFKYRKGHEEVDKLTEQPNGLFREVYRKLFHRRHTTERSKVFDLTTGIYVAISILFFMMEISFIVLIAVYGLSNVLKRDWITVGLAGTYIGGMDFETLFKFLSIGSLALVPLNIISRYIGLGILSFEKKQWIKISFGFSFTLLLVNTGFVVLCCMLFSAERICSFTDTNGYDSCPRMKGIVGVGLGMLIAELFMQIASVIFHDRMYKYLSHQPNESENRHGIIQKMITSLFYGRKVFSRYSQLKKPLIVMSILSAGWLLVQCTFWLGTILVFGSPRYINSTSMQTLYDQTLDDINLGHLANGLAYTSIGVVPVVVVIRLLGIVMTFKERPTLVLVCFITGIVLSISCATLFGLSSYIIKYVSNCFLSFEWRCHSDITEPILTASAVFLTFFVVETVLHVFQSVLFGYVVVLLKQFKSKNLYIAVVSGKVKRLKIADITVKSFEMILEFTMLIALILWLSKIHIFMTDLKTSLHNIGFYSINLNELLQGVVITSIVSISICFINNVIGIVAVVDGFRKPMIGTIGTGGFCLVVNCVILGLQCVLENKVDHVAVSVYLSFTIIQIACQIVWIFLTVLQIKEGNHVKVGNSDSPLTDRTNRRKPSNVVTVIDQENNDEVEISEMTDEVEISEMTDKVEISEMTDEVEIAETTDIT